MSDWTFVPGGWQGYNASDRWERAPTEQDDNTLHAEVVKAKASGWYVRVQVNAGAFDHRKGSLLLLTPSRTWCVYGARRQGTLRALAQCHGTETATFATAEQAMAEADQRLQQGIQAELHRRAYALAFDLFAPSLRRGGFGSFGGARPGQCIEIMGLTACVDRVQGNSVVVRYADGSRETMPMSEFDELATATALSLYGVQR
jgi:hypothetical protein